MSCVYDIVENRLKEMGATGLTDLYGCYCGMETLGGLFRCDYDSRGLYCYPAVRRGDGNNINNIHVIEDFRKK